MSKGDHGGGSIDDPVPSQRGNEVLDWCPVGDS